MKMMRPNPEAVRHLCQKLNCHPAIASILVNRDFTQEDIAFRFLNPTLGHLRPPFSIKDMDAAVGRTIKAILNRERILVFGDYDVDGVTATAVIYEFLSYAGANVSAYIPHRTHEGYGLKSDHIHKFSESMPVDVIITVDCGSSSHNAVKLAKEKKIDVIVTDHHTIFAPIPEAEAVVNPRRADCQCGFDDLAGVGVAFCFLIGLRKGLRDIDYWAKNDKQEPNLRNFCDLVALGTIADMVPLIDENRIFSQQGLEIINSEIRPGLQALLRSCGVRKACFSDIAFKLAPRLNAAGRIHHAQKAFELLTTNDPVIAKTIAAEINAFNTQRQETEKKILEDIEARIASNPDLLNRKTLVLWDESWHEGVLGIIASKVCEKYYRPAILLKIKPNGNAKGSGRSTPSIDIYECLSECRENLIRFGGHRQAAGLEMEGQNLERFRDCFDNAVSQVSAPQDFLPMLVIDYELDFNDITFDLIEALERLEPFGEKNPEPIFLSRHINVRSSREVGRNHRRMDLQQYDHRHIVSAIHFNIDPGRPPAKEFDQVAFRLRRNRWNNTDTIQMVIEAVW